MVTNAKIIEALKSTHGNIMLSAKMLKCARNTIYNRIEKSPEIKKIINDEKEGVIDIAEGALHSAVLNGEPWAITFTLKGIGKSRGHTEKVEQEITGPGGGPLEVRNMSDEDIERKAREILERRGKANPV